MNELVTVIVNVYNGEKYIKKCLDSVVNQTYKNLEILVINDGSTDNTLQICKSYADSRIKIITTSNQGLSLSRNVGLDNAHGKYLYFVDADDMIEKDVIEYLYNLIKKYNLKIATTNHLNIYDYDFVVENPPEQIAVKTSKEMVRETLLNEGRSGTTWNKLIDSQLFKNMRFENRIVNDVALTYKLYMCVDEVVYSNQKKYYYLKHKDSIEGQRKKERSMDMYKASLERYYYIKERWPNFIENEAGILLMIFNIYLRDYEKMPDFFKLENIYKTYNKIFSLKIIKCNMRKNDKLKLILFRINPKLSKLITRTYLRLIKNIVFN